ncbi:MAG: hypothetical protein ACYTAN_13695 [Planctomycetota bacterium]|jgi:uncharacterized protein affecting Mg2+/Co2+ transport
MAKRRKKSFTSTIEVLQKQNGLNFHYDPLERPEGSLIRCKNLMASREGMLESRRGFARYGSVASAAITSKLEFRDRVIRHVGTTTLQYDSDGAGTFSSYSGSFTPPSGHQMRNVESRLANYLTTTLGPYRQDSLTQAPVRSGLPQFLELTPTKTGTGRGPLLADCQLGYRAIFSRKDANEKELAGAPSYAAYNTNALVAATYSEASLTVTVTSNSHGYSTNDYITVANSDDTNGVIDGEHQITVSDGNTFTFTVASTPSPTTGDLEHQKAFDVQLDFPLPDDIVAGDFFEIYRTVTSASATTIVTEEYFLVEKIELSASDISAGTVSYTDNVSADFLGERLYTNPTQGSIARSNDRPPYCVDLVLFKGHIIYVGAKWEQEVSVELRSIAGLTDGTSAITIGSETYTFDTAENVGSKEFQRYTALGTDAQNVAATAKSLVRVINRGSSSYYAWYASGQTGAPGQVLIRHRLLGQSSFAITADLSTTGDNFMPEIPTSGTDVSSSEPGGANYVAISKFENGDAVPRNSTEPLGSEDDAVLRAASLRDSVMLFKALEGVYVMSGETDGTVGATFTFKVRVENMQLFGNNTVATLANRAYAFTSEGFVAVDEDGAEVIGRQVESEALKKYQTTSWSTLAFAFVYPSENIYVCVAPDASGDTYPHYGWTYNALTDGNPWTHGYVKPVTAAMVLSADNKLYLAHAQDYYTLQERKSLDDVGTDFMDEEISVTITLAGTTVNDDGQTVSQVELTYTYANADLTAGFRLKQGGYFSAIESVVDLGSNSYRCVTNENCPYSAAAATVFIPITCELKTSDVFGKNPTLLKQFSEVSFEFEEDVANHHYVAFTTDFTPVESYNSVAYSTFGAGIGWGQAPWGSSPWGSPGEYGLSKTPLILCPPPEYQRARRFSVLYKNSWAGEKVALCQIAMRLRELSYRSSQKSPRP